MTRSEFDRLIEEEFEPHDPYDYAVMAYRIFVKQGRIIANSFVENSEKNSRIAKRILNGNPVIPIGTGRSKILSGDYLKKGCINLGVKVELPETALNIKKYKNPTPLAISTSGSTKEVNELAKQFSEKHIRLNAMTADLKSELAKYADEEDIIQMSVPIDQYAEKSYLLSQLFGNSGKEKLLEALSPLRTLGEWSSHLIITGIIAMMADMKHDIIGNPALYAKWVLNSNIDMLTEFYPHFKRRKIFYDPICQVTGKSDFYGSVGLEYSSHVVRALGMRILQLGPNRAIHVFNSDESNPMYNPEFPENFKKAVIYANSGRGRGFAKDIVEIARNLRSRPEFRRNKSRITTIGMTHTTNSYMHRHCDHCIILWNRDFCLSPDGSTILRSYEPTSIAVSDSLIPPTAIYSGIPLEKIGAVMKENHGLFY